MFFFCLCLFNLWNSMKHSELQFYLRKQVKFISFYDKNCIRILRNLMIINLIVFLSNLWNSLLFRRLIYKFFLLAWDCGKNTTKHLMKLKSHVWISEWRNFEKSFRNKRHLMNKIGLICYFPASLVSVPHTFYAFSYYAHVHISTSQISNEMGLYDPLVFLSLILLSFYIYYLHC